MAGLVEKPDDQGMPTARHRPGRLAEYVRFLARNAVSDPTWRERNTAVAALLVHGVYGSEAAGVLKRLEAARAAFDRGDRDTAYRIVTRLLRQAATRLEEKDTR